MHLADRAHGPDRYHLGHQSVLLTRLALVAHLGGHLRRFGRLPQRAGLIDRVCQRLLTPIPAMFSFALGAVTGSTQYVSGHNREGRRCSASGKHLTATKLFGRLHRRISRRDGSRGAHS